ncbi:hypothetical protein V497_07111 [Pseudogymnoascus sp. VKM F-4516 (FW-969)]|nr:hypothetical protein V497_07111 [Pseudogymnoascus sp. VKM F-4516 (FW-969)]
MVAGLGLWSSSPATFGNLIKETYPIGNGRLGAMPFGPPGAEKVVLNIDSLWSGGPFASSNYTGGNPASPLNDYLPGIRDSIFQNGTGDVSQLLGNGDNYGSYQVFANLSVVIDGVSSTTSYNRSLDFNTGLHTSAYTANDGNAYTSTVYCSYPDQICVYSLSSSAALPNITIFLENQLTSAPYSASCEPKDSSVTLTGVTQAGPPRGMHYEGKAQLITKNRASLCSSSSLVIPSDSKTRTLSLVIGAATNYDQRAGNAESNFSFAIPGSDTNDTHSLLGPIISAVTSLAASKSERTLRQAHIADYHHLASQFTLELPDSAGSYGLETSVLISQYNSSGLGDPYLESTIFALGRHLFISSSRENSLPTNLAGRWSETIEAAWSADYHSNINFQMNHWGADQTGLGRLQVPTWEYMQNTWVPRGTETAKLLYGAPGWVVHDEMNIFGHTAMKEDAQWANYPIAAAWMMQHVSDHFSYSQNVTWYRDQGYPLLKGVAQFWISQLQPDEYFNDGSLVVNPCNSAEHGPTTFGCTHYQQLIHQLFTSISSTASLLPDTEKEFISNVTTALKTLDNGLHIGTWGEVKEWKIPDSLGYDFQNDTHRHLSNFIGWYPGYSVSSFLGGYTNKTIQDAVATTLYSRGPGYADANAGWEKVWRSACWARLNNTDEAYFELRYAIDENFASNGLSMYSGQNQPFQIDANFGIVGAALSMLVVDLPNGGAAKARTVVLGPAIPANWGGGSVKGLRLRGGGQVDFAWDLNGLVTSANASGIARGLQIVNKEGTALIHK